MNKEYAENINRQLNSLRCYGEESMKKLLQLGEEIGKVFSFIEKEQPKDAIKLQGSNMQFVESNGKLEVWIAKPKRREMDEIFSEVKSDFISVLGDYIDRGDTYNLWK